MDKELLDRIEFQAQGDDKRAITFLRKALVQEQRYVARLRKVLSYVVRVRDITCLHKSPEPNQFCARCMANAALDRKCPHGKGWADYCEPCGRVHGGG